MLHHGKYVALFDMHFGWDIGHSRGRKTKLAAHNLAAIRLAVDFITWWKPEIVILGGDQLNCGPVSHFLKGRPRLTEDFRLKEEMDLLYNEVIMPLESVDSIKRRIWHDGNHEVWIQSHIDANPAVEGLIEPVNYLNLKTLGWEIYSQGEVSRVGKVHFVHGDVVLGKGNGKNPALNLVQAYHRNIRAGHLHTLSVATEKNAVDARDFHTGMVVPSLSSRNPVFIKSNPNNFINGFLVGRVHKDGNFNDYPVIIFNNRFYAEGHEFNARTTT